MSVYCIPVRTTRASLTNQNSAITTGMPFLVLRNLSSLGVPDGTAVFVAPPLTYFPLVLSGTALFVAPRLVFIGVAYAIGTISSSCHQ